MSAGETPASAIAARMTRACDGPCGTVRPALAPSWLTAVPRTTASTRSPSASAAARVLRSTRPQPSAQPPPSASAPKLLHRPSGDIAPKRLDSMNMPGSHITVTPPATARSQSPERSARTALWIATSEDEQAVSTVIAGPSSPSA